MRSTVPTNLLQTRVKEEDQETLSCVAENRLGPPLKAVLGAVDSRQRCGEGGGAPALLCRCESDRAEGKCPYLCQMGELLAEDS